LAFQKIKYTDYFVSDVCGVDINVGKAAGALTVSASLVHTGPVIVKDLTMVCARFEALTAVKLSTLIFWR
jgi:hypothetical protein